MRSRRELVLAAALVLTGFSMRTAVTSVGAALDDLQHGLHASSAQAGLVTTLPVVCFAGLGAVTPALARSLGAHRLLVAALALTAGGLALRATAGNAAVFALLSILALSAGATANILMPSLVKEHFPDRIGEMTAAYTTALAVGVTAGAGLTVPIADSAGGWRGGLAAWAVPAVFGILPWLPSVRRAADRATGIGAAGSASGEAPVRFADLARSRTAWALTVFFAAQSIQAYIAFGWFARFLDDHGISHATAGAMVAALSAVGIPVSLVVPRIAPERQRLTVVVLCLCALASYVGLAIAPRGGAWAWMVLAGIGGGTFPVILTIIGQRARTAATTATLSAFVQAIGYIVAGTGPLLFGALFGATGSWALPLAVLFVALAVTLVAGWPCTEPRFVEDEVRPAAADVTY